VLVSIGERSEEVEALLPLGRLLRAVPQHSTEREIMEEVEAVPLRERRSEGAPRRGGDDLRPIAEEGRMRFWFWLIEVRHADCPLRAWACEAPSSNAENATIVCASL
jgi:hypothetical protein